MNKLRALTVLACAATVFAGVALAQPEGAVGNIRGACRELPSHSAFRAALDAVVDVGNSDANGGLANDMWGTLVNRDGIVCAVVFTGDDRGDQWPGSRVISAQKANTANAFSLPSGAGGIDGLALSTANLYFPTQPGQSLFGLQFSNPVDPDVAYAGNARRFGTVSDPMVGQRIGGVNVFGGGLGLYDANGTLIGGLGVSGDTSCTDHIIAWKTRASLGLDNVPAGVGSPGDNIIFDLEVDPVTGELQSPSGFGHPECDPTATAIAEGF